MLWLITYITRGIQFFVQWIWDTFLSQLPFIEDISNILPSSDLLAGGSFTVEMISFLNYWFPLEYAVFCFSSWCSIAVVVYSINWVMGFIPTLN